ncbi:unnamed protein product [Mytilus coruscus]|uniref:Uncharacterized protein n=1 Tax=Mytilus coruscus TaxID=42192 RepID=A0A6J8E459_MYTCO|nr:unnamed protein product [Mytilus coruscus]
MYAFSLPKYETVEPSCTQEPSSDNANRSVQNSPDAEDQTFTVNYIVVYNLNEINNITDNAVSDRNINESRIEPTDISSVTATLPPRINLDINNATSVHLQGAASAQMNNMLLNTLQLYEQTLLQGNYNRPRLLHHDLTTPSFTLQSAMAASFMSSPISNPLER